MPPPPPGPKPLPPAPPIVEQRAPLPEQPPEPPAPEPVAEEPPPPEPVTEEPPPEVVAVEPEESEDEMSPALVAIMAAVQAQMLPCWQDDPSRRATTPPVLIDVTLNRNGSVRRAQIQDLEKLRADPAMGGVAEAARGAVLACSPFDLPRRDYWLWQQMTLRFYPP